MQTEANTVGAVRYPGREQKAMRNMKRTAAVSVMMLALAAGTASAKTIPGTDYGEVLRGTVRADTIHGYGGADLIYGRGGGDTVWGGNEAGKGDKVLGSTGAAHLIGQQGDDALYGEGGGDFIEGQYGDDLVVGGSGADTLSGGPGADKIDARDGRKDTISIRDGEGDVVYYDRGLDVLKASTASQATAGEDAGLSAAEAIVAGKAKAVTEAPPEGLFAHTGEVLVEHEGEGLLLAENKVATHVGHGDEVLDPTGRPGVEGGRN
jgi:Ca2+-binding RTX toxin-like protein